MVWRHAVKAELAKSTDRHFAVILLDLHKCYECINHNKLYEAAVRYGYPLAILRLTISTYRAKRVIQHHGIVTEGVCPSQGIVAGCAFATFELKLLLLSACARHVSRWPSVRLSIFVDNLSLDTTSEFKSEVVEDSLAAAGDLTNFLEDQSPLKVAVDRESQLSTCSHAARDTAP